jgi:hypothetical protein
LVDRHALSRSRRDEHLTRVVLSSPRNLGHGPVEAAGTCRRLDLGKFLGDLVVLRQNLEFGKGEMAETVVPSHQFGLVVRGDDVNTVR